MLAASAVLGGASLGVGLLIALFMSGAIGYALGIGTTLRRFRCKKCGRYLSTKCEGCA